MGKTKRGKGTKIMAVADRHGLPVAVSIASASPHEVTLVGQTLAEMVISDAPEHLIGDNAYDSDKLDAELALCGVKVIAPHRSNRKNRTQDGRTLRRYGRPIRLATEFPETGRSLRIQSRQLPRHGPLGGDCHSTS